MADRSVTICICTRNRPDELRRCLASVRASSVPVRQTVVSDDSTDDRTADLIRNQGYDWVTYFEGPRRGLGANRNCAISGATEGHLVFVDDDGCLGERFLEHAFETLESCDNGNRQRTIVSGCTREHGNLVKAHDQSFLGLQRVPYRPGEGLRTVHMNGTLFPRALFAAVQFDEHLIYGYDEVDVASKAIQSGYRIVQCEEAINLHYPSKVPNNYKPYTEASRLYVTFKRYAVCERAYAKAAAFAVVAPLHCFASAVKRRGLFGVADAWRTVSAAGRYLIRSPG
jgi:GT2 family glycosyltransferase